MSAAMRSELVKLRRRGYLVAAILVPLLAAALFSVLTVVTADEGVSTGAAPAPPGAGVELSDLLASDGAVQGVQGAAALLGLVALSAAATSAAAEYSTGMLRNLLVRQPHRLRLLAGKTAVLCGVAAGVGALATLAGAGSSWLAAAARGLEVGSWTTGEGVTSVLRTALDLGVASAAYAVLGIALGLLLRSAAAAIALAAAWLLPVESLLAAAVGDPARWLPGQLLGDVVTGGGDVGYATALLTGGLWAAGFLAVAGRRLVARDVVT